MKYMNEYLSGKSSLKGEQTNALSEGWTIRLEGAGLKYRFKSLFSHSLSI